MSILLQNKARLSRDRLGHTQLGASQQPLFTWLVVGAPLTTHVPVCVHTDTWTHTLKVNLSIYLSIYLLGGKCTVFI